MDKKKTLLDFFKSAEDSSSSTSNTRREDKDNSDSESETQVANPSKRKRNAPIRKYDEEYLAYGFVCAGTAELPQPQCLVCNTILANSSLKPAKLIRHLKTNHAELEEKPIQYFQSLKNENKSQSQSIREYSGVEFNAIKSSFVAAYKIAKEKTSFTTAERLLKPVLVEISRIMLGESAVAKMNAVPLSGDTVTRRVCDMSIDIQEQLSLQLKKGGNFTLQFDESTDISNEAILIGFVRYVNENKISEELFCFCSLPERTTSDEIFRAIEEKMRGYELEWKNVVGVCTDGAAAMTGIKAGLAKQISRIANEDFMASHCVLHREALASKKLSPALNETLKNAVHIINNVKARPLHSRIFSKICAEMNSDHRTLLLHAEVRWLSRGRGLNRIFELRTELVHYFEKFMEPILAKRKKMSPEQLAKVKRLPEEDFLDYLRDDEWISKLAYLADIFELLNSLNLQGQGKGANCFQYYEKIEAFKKKMVMWKKDVDAGKFQAFSLVENLLSQNEALVDSIKPIIQEHLEHLIEQFEEYFPTEADPREAHMWIVDPFLNINENNSLSEAELNLLLGNLYI